MRAPLSVGLLGALVLFGSLQGCSKRKNEDCQRLVQAAGPQHAALTAAFGRSDQPPAELEAQAVAWDKAAAELSALPLETEEAKGLAGQFATVMTKGAKIRRDMAAAAGALDPTAAATVQGEAVKFIAEEMRVKASLDMACR